MEDPTPQIRETAEAAEVRKEEKYIFNPLCGAEESGFLAQLFIYCQ